MEFQTHLVPEALQVAVAVGAVKVGGTAANLQNKHHESRTHTLVSKPESICIDT